MQYKQFRAQYILYKQQASGLSKTLEAVRVSQKLDPNAETKQVKPSLYSENKIQQK